MTIAVVGAGLAGLTAARILQQRGLQVAVFEREPSRHSRPQGGVLDMHLESGQWALQQAGLTAELKKLVIPGGQDMRILDRKGKILWEEVEDQGANRPEVERPALRNLLLDSLQPGTIRWGQQLTAVNALKLEGMHSLHFANGNSVSADFVIGAEGAASRTRSLVIPQQPSYAGGTFLEMEITQPSSQVSKTVGRGSMFALGDNKGLITHRAATGRIILYAVFRMRQNGFPEMGVDVDGKCKHAVASQFDGWAPELIDLVKACGDTVRPWPVHAMPIGVSWSSKAGVTVIGDAAHLMSPFAGEGANLAMQDGAELGLELARHGPGYKGCLEGFEAGMFSRALEPAKMSAENMDMCISWDGSHRLADMMRSFHDQHKHA